jgi:hypothetical protein
MRKDVCADG